MTKRMCATRLIFFVAIALFYAQSDFLVFAATDVPGGVITGSVTWSKAGSPYVIKGDVFVQTGSIVTVEPGAVVKFDRRGQGNDAAMFVDGSLVVNGTPEDRVVFTTIADDTFGGDTGNDGDTFASTTEYAWGLYISGTGSRFDNALIANYGSFRFTLASTSLSNIEIRHGQGAVSFSRSSASLTDVIMENVRNGGIGSSESVLAVASTTLLDIHGESIIAVYLGEVSIRDMRVSDTSGKYVLKAQKTKLAIENSIFTNGSNSDPAFYIFDTDFRISSTTVSNHSGGGMAIGGGDFEATGLSVTDNQYCGVSIGENPSPGDYYYTVLRRAVLTRSRISGNADCGLAGYARIRIDARDNWWGAESGPRVESMPGSVGTGDLVKGSVDAEPWLASDPWAPAQPTCCSSILFLPGLEASRLYKLDGGSDERIWEPRIFGGVIDDLYLDENGDSVRTDVYAQEVIDQLPVFGENVYKSLIADLRSWKDDERLISDYSLIPYDWRLTMDDILSYGNDVDGKIYYSGDYRSTSTPYVIQELRRLASGSKTGKVTIIAHSNGGLLAKALLKTLKDTNDPLLQKLDQVIMVAVPQTGTPEAIGALLHGYEQGHFPVITKEEARTLAKNMPGAYPLLPSSAYWTGAGSSVATPVIRFEDDAKGLRGETLSFAPIADSISKYSDSIDSREELDGFLRGEEGRVEPEAKDVASPSKVNAGLLAYGNALHAQLDGLEIPGHITVHQIAGWGEETLSSIAYRPKVKKCAERSHSLTNYCLKYELGWTYKPELVMDGDGTVVTPSALAMSTSSPNIKRWWVDLKKYNETSINRDHKSILEVSHLLTFIKEIVNTSIPKTNQVVRESEPPPTEDERLVFTLHSPLDLAIVDRNGNSVSSTTHGIPGARYKRFGEVQYISVPKDANPTVELKGQAAGYFDLEIEQFEGDIPVATTTFAAIYSATSTVAAMAFADGTLVNASDLEIDEDGDGVVEVSLKPIIGETVTAPETVDRVAPEAIIKFSTSTNAIEITGVDDFTRDLEVGVSPKTATIEDEAGNLLTLKLDLEVKKNQVRTVITKLAYATATEMSIKVKASARYHWSKSSSGKQIFAAHLKTQDENLVAIYNAHTNQTRIVSLVKSVEDVDFENVEHKLPNGSKEKRTSMGLITPFLESEKGKILIKY